MLVRRDRRIGRFQRHIRWVADDENVVMPLDLWDIRRPRAGARWPPPRGNRPRLVRPQPAR